MLNTPGCGSHRGLYKTCYNSRVYVENIFNVLQNYRSAKCIKITGDTSGLIQSARHALVYRRDVYIVRRDGRGLRYVCELHLFLCHEALM